MNNREEQDEKIWALLHGDLDVAERKALEESIAGDPELAREHDVFQRMDKGLRSLLPGTATTADELTEEILAAWEKDQKRHRSGDLLDIRRSRPLWRGPAMTSTLALAACVMIMIGIRAQTFSPIEWAGVTTTPAVFRGPDQPEPQPSVAKEKSGRLASSLQIAIEERYMDSIGLAGRLIHRRTWVLKAELQDRADGSLSIAVKAYTPAQDAPAGAWSLELAEQRDWDQAVRSFGDRIADDLAGMRMTDTKGRQAP